MLISAKAKLDGAVIQNKNRNLTKRKANTPAKSKEVQLNSQANSKLKNIFYCLNPQQQR